MVAEKYGVGKCYGDIGVVYSQGEYISFKSFDVHSFGFKMHALSAVLIVACFLCNAVNGVNPRPYPPVDSYLPTTDFLDHKSYLNGLDDHQWYLDNIPFIDVPDKSIQDVYYYRTSVIKRHIKWAHEGHGWVVTEFIHPVSCKEQQSVRSTVC